MTSDVPDGAWRTGTGVFPAFTHPGHLVAHALLPHPLRKLDKVKVLDLVDQK
ncbi:hypothetical protein ACFYPT_39125 [Streptomyces sp. NPDC005529]|uniref:hypothetical protein n=1 Tax=unclassified Streptomyces TaxID=2593676 RepID=UPI0033B44769